MLNERIEAERAARDWSMRTLAERSGISEGYLWLLAKGRRPNPTADTLEKLARAFGITVDALLGTEERAALDTSQPPVELWRALHWPDRLIADGERDWPMYSEAQRLNLIKQARALYESQYRSKPAV